MTARTLIPPSVATVADPPPPYNPAHGREAHRRVRLRRRRTDGVARVPRHAPARGLRLPRRRRAAPVRPAPACRAAALRPRDRPVPRGAGGQAGRRRLQLGNGRRAARAPDRVDGAGRRSDRAGGTRSRPGDPKPSDRAARDPGDRLEWPVRGARARARRRCRGAACRVPASRAADRGRRPVRRGDGCRRARICRAAERGGRRHGHPRLHALPADPADSPARVRARCDARLLGRGDGPRGGGDAEAEADRERRVPRRRLSVPHDRGRGRVPRDGAPISAASDRRRRAGRDRDPRGGVA